MPRTSIDTETAHIIGVEAFTYLYPLPLLEFTRGQMTNVAEPAGLHTPMQTFVHARAFPTADFKDVVRPNFDTLYSSAWLDLSAEPMIVTVADAGDNYYLLPMYDMWGEVFACPGSRTTGSGRGEFALVGPGWEGELPAGVRRYDAPTSVVWIIGRTEASPETYEQVHAFQDGLTVQPLSTYGTKAVPPGGTVDPKVDDTTPPLRQVAALSSAEFFAMAAELLKLYPPHFNDYPVLDRLAQIGFVPGESFDLAAAPEAVRAGLETAAAEAMQKITEEQLHIGKHANGWLMNTESMGNYGTNYLRRACVELVGLGANLAEDAIYPLIFADSDGQPFTGEHSYVWHMTAEQIPPVNAFWSLTLYDAEGFQVANELNRFAIGDRDHLEFNADGSLDIWVQQASPGAARESNWLPAPAGGFNLCARLYYPKPAALDDTWSPAPVTKA